MKKFLLVLMLLASALPAWAQGTAAPAPAVPGYEAAANAIVDNMTLLYGDSRGPNLENVFNVLGALAGYGCQMAVREGIVKPGLLPEEKAFIVYTAPNGERYFFGNFINASLLGNEKIKTSVWSLIAEAAQQAGAKELPDIQELAAHTLKTVGTKDFGVPRVPPKYHSGLLPVDALKKNWLPMQKILVANQVDPKLWGWTFALAARKLILKNKDSFDPAMAAKILMEAAMPMSKIDPATIAPIDINDPRRNQIMTD